MDWFRFGKMFFVFSVLYFVNSYFFGYSRVEASVIAGVSGLMIGVSDLE